MVGGSRGLVVSFSSQPYGRTPICLHTHTHTPGDSNITESPRGTASDISTTNTHPTRFSNISFRRFPACHVVCKLVTAISLRGRAPRKYSMFFDV